MESIDGERVGAIYSRVALRDDFTIDAQVESCLVLAQRIGVPVDETHIWREGGSGMDRNRNGLKELQTLISTHSLTDIIIYSPDRISRDPLHFVVFARQCDEAGARLHFVVGCDLSLYYYIFGESGGE